MRIFWALLWRELGTFFYSITGYVIIAAVALVIGSTFVMLIHNLGMDPISMPLTEVFFNSLIYWIIVILVAPVITMRLFALEKASGTFETLMTTQVGDAQVVAAKFSTAAIFYLLMWLPAFASLFIVQHFTNQPRIDWGMMGGMGLGILLSGCLFLAIGCLASAMTKNQVTAAMISLAVGVILFIVAYMAQNISSTDQSQLQILSYFNLFQQMQDFTRGVVDTRTVIFYGSATFLFLFLTLRVVESRRWK